MSEQDNTHLVQRAYQAFGSGDSRTFLRLLAPDVEWAMPKIAHVPFSGTWHGHEGVQDFFSRLAATQDVVEFQPEEFIAQGEQVIALGRFEMRVKATGRASKSHWAHLWKIQHGKIIGFREYVDTAAVGAAHSP